MTLTENTSLSRLQLQTIFVCFFMNMLDGMDVQVIAYTATAIQKSWGIDAKALASVFVYGLIGMTVGTMFLAPYADRIGRKTMMFVSAILMGTCIYATAYATSIPMLQLFRFLSGLGIGCMLASTAVLTSEYTPSATRNFWVSFVVSGYPIGAVLSGYVAAQIVPTQGWEQMFKYAGLASMLAIPIVWFLLSESVEFYLKAQPKNALDKINAINTKIGRETLPTLPEKAPQQPLLPLGKLMADGFLRPTIELWITLFMAFASLYFMTLWIPKLSSDAGLSAKLSIYAGVVFNLGAFLGIITQGYFSSKFGLKKTIGTILTLTAVLMVCFRFFVGSDYLLLVFAMLGFGIQGGFVGLYAFAARMYPAEFKATGIGWAMGAGRLGSIMGPGLTGLLISQGLGIGDNFLIYAIPTLIAGILTWVNSSKNVD